LQIRSRECNNPAPGTGGQSCQGDFQEVQYCNEQSPCAPKGIILYFVALMYINKHYLNFHRRCFIFLQHLDIINVCNNLLWKL
jgi:hypothetical protein